MERADTRDIAALLAAVDDQGQVDQVVFEAHRLILHNQRGGSLDSDALMRSVHQSLLYDTPDRDRLIHLIDDNLDSALDQQRFHDSMKKSYALNEAGHEVGVVYEAIKDRVVGGNQAVSDRMAGAQQWAQGLANDPQHGAFLHGVGVGASFGIGAAQKQYGQVKGAASDAAGAVTGVVDLGKMAYRLGTDESYRNALVGLASGYASEVAQDPAKPVRDLYHGGKDALHTWQAGFAQAKVEGREQEYVGHTQGVVGMELLLAVVPATKAGKFGEVARILDHAPIRSTEEAVEVLAKASVLQREGGDAARGAEAIIAATARDTLVHGDLSMVLEAARKTDTINGLLRSGELEPRELSEIAKLDHTVFKSPASTSTKDGVTFAEALSSSTQGLDLTKLTTRQLGDVGEAIHTYDMVREGYTDIIAVKNNSGHGIDFVGRNPKGELEFHEVKTSAVGRAAEQKGNPTQFVNIRLQRAIDEQGHWATKNTLPGLADTAQLLADEVKIGGGKVNSKWVKINLSHSVEPNGLKVEKTIEEWTTAPKNVIVPKVTERTISPTIANSQPLALPASMRDPGHPGHGMFTDSLDVVHRMEAKHGVVSGAHSEQVAAALATQAERLRLSVDHVRMDPKGEQVTLVRSPRPNEGGEEKTASISMHQALSSSVEEHSSQWLNGRSPHYANAEQPVRTAEQAGTLSQLSPADQAIFARIRGQAPGSIGDDAVAQATVAARENHITKAEDISSTGIFAERLYVMGSNALQLAVFVDLSQPAPSLQHSVQQAQAMDQQQVQQHQMTQQQLNQMAPQGPVMG